MLSVLETILAKITSAIASIIISVGLVSVPALPTEVPAEEPTSQVIVQENEEIKESEVIQQEVQISNNSPASIVASLVTPEPAAQTPVTVSPQVEPQVNASIESPSELVVVSDSATTSMPSESIVSDDQTSTPTSPLATSTPLEITATPSDTNPKIPAEEEIPATLPSGGGGGGGGGGGRSATPAPQVTPTALAEPDPEPEPTPTEDTDILCSDGTDNDGDGLIDLDDPDCSAFIPTDTTPPVISNVQVTSIAETSATITWTTDEPASSDVHYALDTLITASTTNQISGTGDVTSHSVDMTGLSPGTIYYYAAVSTDGNGNTATSSEQSFTTFMPPPPPEPEIDFVLQPGISMSINGSSVNVDIQIHNLTCRFNCDMVLPATDVVAYYTDYYPNDDGAVEVGPHVDEMFFTVSDIPNWGQYDTQWSSSVPPGHYLFVVITDPENLNNMYSMFRSEFTISP